MGDEQRLWKWVLIVGLVVIAVLLLYPPQDKLKPGIDLAGGTSLIYEIDMTGLAQRERSNLAEREGRGEAIVEYQRVWPEYKPQVMYDGDALVHGVVQCAYPGHEVERHGRQHNHRSKDGPGRGQPRVKRPPFA